MGAALFGKTAPPRPQLPIDTQHDASSLLNLTSNSPLDESAQLLAEDVEWLDESEMQAQEDEDYRCAKELYGDSSLQDWTSARVPANAEASVIRILKNPETVSKSMGRKTVEYTIQTSTTSVKRRYGDFEALRYGLAQRFPGTVVPPLPERKQFGKTDPKFIESRRLHLECFLSVVMRNIFFANDDMFVEFIASSSPFDRKSAMTSRKTLIKNNKLTVASKRWSQALLASESPKDPVALLDATIKELEVMKKSLLQARNAFKHMGVSIIKTSEACALVAEAMTAAQTAENNLIVFGTATQAPMQYSSLMGEIFRISNVVLDTTRNIHVAEVEAMYLSLMASIRYEIVYMETFMASVRRTRTSVARHVSAIKSYREAKLSPDAAKFVGLQVGFIVGGGAGGAGGDMAADDTGADATPHNTRLLPPLASVEMDQTRRKLTKLRIAAVAAQRNARRDIVGTLVLALQRFRSERVERIRMALSVFAMAKSEQIAQLGSAWQRFCGALGDVAKATLVVEGTTPTSSGGVHGLPTPSGNHATSIIPRVGGALTAGSPSNQGIQKPSSVLAEAEIPTVPGTRRASQLRALYQFSAENEDELTVQPGEILAGAVADEDPEWYVATSQATGKTGLVPANFVEVMNDGNDNEAEEDDVNEVPPEEKDEDEEGGGGGENGAAEGIPPVTNYIKMTQQSMAGQELKHPAATGLGSKKRTQEEL